MSTSVGTVVIDVKADTAKLVSGMSKAEQTVKKSVNNIKTAIVSMAAAYAGIEGVKAFDGMINDSLEAADNVGKLSQKLGMTTEELSKLQYTAKLADVSNGELTAGLGALIRRLNNFQQDGGGAAKDAFAELGISAEYARTHLTSTDAAFKEIIKRLEEMPDGYKKTAIAQDIFSKSASGILKITATDLKQLGDEAQRIGLTISQSTYEMAAAYHDQISQLDARLKGIKQTISFSVIEPMNAASKTAVEMYDSMFGSSSEKIQLFEDSAVTAIGNVVYSIGFIKDAFTGVELVLNTIEHAFYTMALGINKVFDVLVTDKINSAIDAYNKVASLMGKDEISNVVNQTTVDLTKKMIELRKESDMLIDSISNGRSTSDEFMNNFKNNLSEIKKEAGKTKKSVDDIGKKSKNTNDIKKENEQWIKDLKEFYDIDIEKGLNDQKTKEKTKATFEDWGKTLNSSISNSIVDALQSGDVEGAIQGLGSSIGSSMLQSSTANLVAGGKQLSLAGGAMSMGGIYGIAAGLGIGAVSKFMDNGTASKTSQQYADEAFNKFISNIEKASKALESFGNVGSSFSTELDTLNKEIQAKQNILNEYNSKPHYIVTKSMRDTVSNDINRLTSRKNELLVNQLGGSIDFSRMNLSDVSKALPANFSLDSYNNALDDINRLALKAKEVGFNNMSEADIQRFTDLTANGSVWQAGKDYADAISLIDDAMKKSVSNIKAYEDSFKTPKQLAEDMAKDLGVTLASSTKGLDNLFNSLKGGVDGLNDAESELLKANKDLIDSNMQSLNNAFLGQYSPLTMSQKTDYANSIASGAIPSNLSSSESSLLALQTAMNSTTDENEATKAFNRYIATIDATEPDSTRTDIVNELRSNRETLNDIVDRLERIEA